MSSNRIFYLKRWGLLCLKFRCSLKEFKNYKLHQGTLDRAKWKLLSAREAEKIGISPERAIFKIEEAERLLEISVEDYHKNSYWQYTNFNLLQKLFSPTKEEKIDKMADVVALRLKCRKESAKQSILDISKTYNVSLDSIMTQCYYKAAPEIIKSGAERRFGNHAQIASVAKAVSVDFTAAENRMQELQDKFGVHGRKEIVKYFHMSDKEIFAKLDAVDEKRVRTIARLAKLANQSVADFWHNRELVTAAFGTTNKLYKGFSMWDKTDEEIGSFILGSDMYYLMSKYNVNGNIRILADKLTFAETFTEVYGRKFWINKKTATFESFKNFAAAINYGSIIVKPTKGLKRSGIEKIKLKKENLKDVYEYLLSLDLAVVDECVVQHEKMAQFGAGAVNTIRVLTIYDNGKCNIIYAVVRVGMNDVVDNFHSGGYIARINKESGIIEGNGYPMKDMEYTHDPCSNKKIIGTQIPYWDQVIELVKYSSKKVKDIGYVGWDVAISETGPVLIEGNQDAMAALVEFSYKERKVGHRESIKQFLDESMS